MCTQSTTCFLGTIRVHNPNGISISSAFFARFTTVTDYATPSVTIGRINSMLTQHGSSVQWQCTGLNQWILSASSPVSTDKSSWSVTSHPAWTRLHRNSKQENKSPEINSYVVQHSNPSVVHIASVLVLLVLAIFFQYCQHIATLLNTGIGCPYFCWILLPRFTNTSTTTWYLQRWCVQMK